MNDWTRVFSGPTPGDHQPVLDAISTAWAGSVVERFLDRHATTLDTSVADHLAAWLTGSSSYDEVAHFAFGRADMLLKGRLVDPRDVGGRLALRLSEHVRRGDWEITLPATTFVFEQHVVKDVIGMATQSDSDHIRISFQRATGSPLVVTSGVAGSCHNSERLRSFTADRSITLYDAGSLPRDVGSRDIFADCTPVEQVDHETRASFQAGCDLIGALVPQYLPWIGAVLKGVVAGERDSAYHLTSGSWEDALGQIHMSSPHSPIDVADTLIHESAHQYFYLLERVGPIDDGSDDSLHYSPATRTNRPISRLLMALHAFVNVLELYEAVRASDRPEISYVNANLPVLQRDIGILDEPLRQSRALTDLGRAIYDPLRERLADLALR